MINITRELVTPFIAKQYLEANISNRRVKQPVVARYAIDMANGRWKEDTAEMIKISKTGVILDGQHRLLAVIKANKPIWFHVAKGLEDSVFDVLDTGSLRNATDAFMVKGIKNECSIPSIISMYNLLVLGRKDGLQKKDKATNAILLEQYFQDEMFWQNAAKKSLHWYISFAKILTPSMIGGFYAFLCKKNEDKAEQFMEQLCTGINIQNNVVGLLRTKLMQDKMSQRKMPPTLKMALIIKTWNCYISKTEIKLLKYDTVRDEFPIALNN
jgi:hypothetical protein